MKTLHVMFAFTVAATIITALTVPIVTQRQANVSNRDRYLAAHCYDDQGFTGTDICNQVMTGKAF